MWVVSDLGLIEHEQRPEQMYHMQNMFAKNRKIEPKNVPPTPLLYMLTPQRFSKKPKNLCFRNYLMS